MNEFDITPGRFDRVVSVEMFEHMKNWPRLMANIARWLKSGGMFFVHVFTHSRFAYHFVVRDQSDWMSREVAPITRAASESCQRWLMTKD